MKRPLSLTLRLIIFSSIWSTLLLAFAGIGLSQIFTNSLKRGFEREINVSIDALSANIDIANQSSLILTRPLSDPRFSRPLSGYYWKVALLENNKIINNEIFLKSRSLFDEDLVIPFDAIAQAYANFGSDVFFDKESNGEILHIGLRAIKLPVIDKPLLIIVAENTAETKADARKFNWILFSTLAALAFGLVIAIIILVRIGLSPLRKTKDQLAQIRQGEIENLSEKAPAEIAPLAKELNVLLAHNKEVVERARTHVGNLAHAIKTPISVILNESNSQKGDFSNLVKEQALIMTRQIDHYLKRARAAASAETLKSRAPIMEVAEAITRTLNQLYRHEGVKISLLNKTKKIFRGDREDLEDLIGNLAENACKYGGGLVEISFDESQSGFIQINIEDDGYGLSENQISLAMKRGVRLDETVKGSGLGLSISAELAETYGGSLHLKKSDLGGLKAVIILPTVEIMG